MTSTTRRRFLRSATTGFAATSLVPVVASQGTALPPRNFRTIGAPVVQAPTGTEATIAWGVNDTSTGWVEYGETEALGHVAHGDDEGLCALDATVHKVRLAGLRPGTRYFYRTVSVPIAFLGPYDIRRGRPFESRVFTFSTGDEGRGDEVSFSVINDTHERTETVQALFARMAAQPSALTFWNGDMFDDINSHEQLAAQLLAPANMPYAAETPVYFVRGNHDVRGVEARALARFVDVPAGHWFYSFRQGPVAFIVLDTGEDKPDDHPAYAGLGAFDAYRTRQAAWLADELRKAHVRTARFRVVVAHIPLYSARPTQAHGGADARAKWHDHLVAGGVDLLITGHTHRHAWMAPEASRPFGQLTGGGPQLDGATLIQGRATADALHMVMQTPAGVPIWEHTIRPRG